MSLDDLYKKNNKKKPTKKEPLPANEVKVNRKGRLKPEAPDVHWDDNPIIEEIFQRIEKVEKQRAGLLRAVAIYKETLGDIWNRLHPILKKMWKKGRVSIDVSKMDELIRS